MNTGGFELTKLTYNTRLEENLIRHRGDRLTSSADAAKLRQTLSNATSTLHHFFIFSLFLFAKLSLRVDVLTTDWLLCWMYLIDAIWVELTV